MNQLGEWTRSLNNKWSGMSSPIKQIEMQQALLLEMLHHNRTSILGKLLGLKQQSFNLRCWDNICVVTSASIINRETIPTEISSQLVKVEFLVDKVNETMKLRNLVINILNPFDTAWTIRLLH